MKRRIATLGILTTCVLAAGGCGAVPDVVAESFRSAAKEALDEAVEEVVDDAVDELFDAGSELLPDPFTTGSNEQAE